MACCSCHWQERRKNQGIPMLEGYTIAVVEDDEFMGSSLVQRLELEGARTLWMRQMVRALGALRSPVQPVDAVICDIRLPDGTGEELFLRLNETSDPPPFLFVTGHGGIEQAVRLMRAGAVDYITKPFEISALLERLSTLLAGARSEVDMPQLVGISPAARKVEALMLEAAREDRSVLVSGGPGVGKSRVARRIHELSDRRAAPFVLVNLARDADAPLRLIEDSGPLHEVGEGTLYIHALERLGGEVAAKLLERLDRFSGRIVAASLMGVGEIIAQGGALAELVYRLDLFELAIPPLGRRGEDAVWLMHRLFPKMNARRSSPLEGIGQLAEEAVRTHDWPGGGRELRARLSHGVAGARGPLLGVADLFPERMGEEEGLGTLAEAREAAERRQIALALERTGGRIGQAARILKVSRTTLWEKMQRYGLAREEKQG